MFTVRVIENTGHERIYETKQVSSEPGSQINGGERKVFIDREDGGKLMIDSGTVYVMNDAGRTVADYHFNTPPSSP